MIHNVGNPILVINLPVGMIYTTHLWEFWGWFIIGFTTVYIYLLLTKWNLVNINGMGQLWGIRIIDWLIFEAPIPRLLRVPQHKYLTLSRYISVMVKPSTEWSASEFRGLTSLTRMFSPHLCVSNTFLVRLAVDGC